MKTKNIQIAEFAISAIMGRPCSIMISEESPDKDFIVVEYSIDKVIYKYKVKFEKNKIIWGNIWGRWRDEQEDELITFQENGDKISIIQKFSKKQIIKKEFKLENL